MKRFISITVTLLIVITCFTYTYNDHKLPFKQRYLEFYNESGTEYYLKDMNEQYKNTKDSLIDSNVEWRKQNITVTGNIKVGSIVEENNYYRVISDRTYTQTQRSPWFCNAFTLVGDPYPNKYVVIYFKKENSDVKQLIKGDKIYFSAKFNNMNDICLVVTQGELL